MKTIFIRLPDVEAAMLVEVQKVNRAYRDLQGLLISQIQQEYAKTPKGRASRCKPRCPHISNVTLTTPSATGLFLSHHAAVQQPSVFDC